MGIFQGYSARTGTASRSISRTKLGVFSGRKNILALYVPLLEISCRNRTISPTIFRYSPPINGVVASRCSTLALLFSPSETAILSSILQQWELLYSQSIVRIFVYLFTMGRIRISLCLPSQLARSVFCDLSTKCNYKELFLVTEIEYPERVPSTILFPQNEHKSQTPDAAPPLPRTRTIGRIE